MSAPRRVTCVCLQSWPLARPHTAAPGARCFLTNTWRVPERGPATLCLKDRQKAAPLGCRRPSGSTRRAALPPRPLAADTARYWPPVGQKAGVCGSLPSAPTWERETRSAAGVPMGPRTPDVEATGQASLCAGRFHSMVLTETRSLVIEKHRLQCLMAWPGLGAPLTASLMCRGEARPPDLLHLCPCSHFLLSRPQIQLSLLRVSGTCTPGTIVAPPSPTSTCHPGA